MRHKSNPLAIKALEIVEDALKDEEERAIKKALSLISEDGLTADLALQLFYEIRALRAVPAKLRKQGRAHARTSQEKPVDELL